MLHANFMLDANWIFFGWFSCNIGIGIGSGQMQDK